MTDLYLSLQSKQKDFDKYRIVYKYLNYSFDCHQINDLKRYDDGEY